MSLPETTAPPGAKLTGAPPRWIFFAIFTISGFSGLIYESIWSHYLKLFLGHAAYAQSLVLMIFMGGLALGSWLTARFSERIRTPILVYALVEAVIGIVALLFHSVFVSISDAFYFSLLPSLDAPLLAAFLKWSAAAALIMPQSVLLGMTFPLMTTGIVRRYPNQPGGSLAMLYFTNSIGAAFGVLASGFWLIGMVGLPGTIMTAGLINVLLALIVFVLVRLDPEPERAPIERATDRDAVSDHKGLAALFFVAAGITGAASFMYEIGWIRMLSLVLGATTHSFELMLSAFITGLAFGGLWIKRRIDRIGNPVRFAGWVQVLMGAVAILTVPLYVKTFDWMALILSGLERSAVGYNLFTAVSHGIALAVMLPATFLAGMTLPLFTHVLMRGRQGEKAIGRVYAANTLGAIVGVLFAVHVGLPVLGLKWLIGLGALLDVVLGVVLLHRARPAQQARSGLPGPLLGAVVGGLAVAIVAVVVDLDPRRLSSGVYRYALADIDEGSQVLYYEDGKTASISLTSSGTVISIKTNGKPDASIQMDPNGEATNDEITMVMAAALPLAYRPGADSVANIGFGSGLTTHTLLADPDVEVVDTVEIERSMVEAATGFGERVERAYADPRSRIHIEDAKTFFSLQNRKYDAIVAEPSNPWVSGVASLFSEEFYRTIGNYLEPGGVLVQWLQLYEFNDRLVMSVVGALDRHFSDYVIFNSDNTNILIVATPTGLLPSPAFHRLFTGDLKSDLEVVGLRNEADFLVRRTGSRALMSQMLSTSGVPTNSDYFPFLDLNAGQARFRGQVATLFYSWSIANLPILEMIEGGDLAFGNVTPNPWFERTLLIQAAGRNAELLAEPRGTDLSDVNTIDPYLRILRYLRNDCTQEDNDAEWSSSLHVLATNVIPYMDSEEATALFSTVRPPECRTHGSDALRAWVTLYEVVAARDAARMARAARQVLDSDPDADLFRRRYALMAGMLGHLAARQPGEALALWENREHFGAGDVATSAPLDLLIGTARSRAETQ